MSIREEDDAAQVCRDTHAETDTHTEDSAGFTYYSCPGQRPSAVKLEMNDLQNEWQQ